MTVRLKSLSWQMMEPACRRHFSMVSEANTAYPVSRITTITKTSTHEMRPTQSATNRLGNHQQTPRRRYRTKNTIVSINQSWRVPGSPILQPRRWSWPPRTRKVPCPKRAIRLNLLRACHRRRKLRSMALLRYIRQHRPKQLTRSLTGMDSKLA